MNSISFFKALLLKESVEVPAWLKGKLEDVHTKPGQGSIFSKSVEDVLKIAQDALDKESNIDKIANSTGTLTIKSPGIGYNLVLPIDKAKQLPGAKESEVEKIEGPNKIKVPAITTTAPITQFKTDDLTVIVRPKKDDSGTVIPNEYIVLSAFPGDPTIPRASEWDGKYAVIIPGSSMDLKELQYFHNGSEMNQVINYDDSDITDDLESFGQGSMDGQDFKPGQTYNIAGQEYKVEPQGDEFKLVLAETKQNKMNNLSFFKALLMKEMDEASFTDKYNDSPKLKGGQKNLPDELQAQLVKKGMKEDHEVSMAHNSLESIIKSAMELKMKLGNDERNIPGWIQDHITNAENYIDQAAQGFHELSHDDQEGEHDVDELPNGNEEEPVDDMALQSIMEVLFGEAKKKPSAGLTKKQKSTIAKKAKAGKDIGKKGKGFEMIAKKAAKKYGSKERGQAVAAAAMWKSQAKKAK